MKRSGDKIVELVAVTKEYKLGHYTIKALDSVDLSVARGEFVSVMGPSGSGKTTLLNVIGCLTKPTSGKVFINGVDVTTMDDRELSRFRSKFIGFIFQGYNLIPTFTVLENVLVPVVFYKGRVSSSDVERATSLLAELGLADRLNQYPNTLSFGQQQRVAVARAVINDPELILADEPTGTLDSVTAKQVVGILKKLNEEGKTVILVTHDPEVAAAAERRYLLRDGRLSEG